MSPVLLWLAQAALGAVTVEGEPEDGPPIVLRQGEEVVLAVTDAEGEARSGETVRVVHRPGLAGEAELAIGISDGRGRVRWTPELSGLARLRAGDEVRSLRIAPAAPPLGVEVTLGLLLVTSLGAFGYGWVGPRGRARRG
ncbi:MAG: hypothetical protein R3F59_10150 [Myxococcota bacterium]